MSINIYTSLLGAQAETNTMLHFTGQLFTVFVKFVSLSLKFHSEIYRGGTFDR